MRAWWTDDELEDWVADLLNAATAAHHSNTFRQNQSAVAVQLAASGSGNYMQAIAMALLTLGGQHGPILDAYDLLAADHPGAVAKVKLQTGRRVPGWGNAFVKGQIDPAWAGTVELLKKGPLWAKVEDVQQVMDAKGLFPNPAALSAAVALTARMPRHICPWVGAMGRILAWSQLYHQFYKEPPR